jgi:hypothetical protein
MSDPRRTLFAPVVLAGLASAGLTCVAAAKPWFTASLDAQARLGVRAADTRADMPVALALALVVLAAWGVVLVGRTPARRIVLTLAVLAAAGVLVTLVTATGSLPGQIRDQLGSGHGSVAVDPTGWFVTAAVTGVLSLAAVVAGWMLAPRWPTMSSRYDAPTTRPELVTDTDLWKAMDQGQDPTEPGAP